MLGTAIVLYWVDRLNKLERDIKLQKAYMEEVWATFNKQSATIKRMQQEQEERQAERFHQFGRIIELTNPSPTLTNVQMRGPFILKNGATYYLFYNAYMRGITN